MSKDKETKKELILHKLLIKDLMCQTNITLHSYLQLCELIELIIKIIMKQSGCQRMGKMTVNQIMTRTRTNTHFTLS